MTSQQAVKIDVDHVSFALPVEFLPTVSPDFILGNQKLTKLKDRRLTDYLLLATGPQVLFVEKKHKGRIAAAFLEVCHRYIHLSTETDLFTAGSSAARVDACDLKDILKHADVDHVIVYLYGMKNSEPRFWSFIDSHLFREIEANTYDIGFVFKFDGVPFLDHGMKNHPNFSYPYAYRIFAGSHNAVTFKGIIRGRGNEVNIYNPIVHLMKSVWGRNPEVPQTYAQGRACSRCFETFRERINEDPERFSTSLRFEVSVKGSSLHEAFETVKDMQNLAYWEELGVKIRVIDVWTYLDDVNKSIEALLSNNIFQGRDENYFPNETRRLIEKALIHCGYVTMPPVGDYQIEDIRATARNLAYNPTRAKRRSEEALEIATYIFVKESTSPNRIYYNLVKLDGTDWNPHGGPALIFDNPNPATRMYQIVKTVYQSLGYTWRTVLQQSSQPNPFVSGLYFGEWDNYVRVSTGVQTDIPETME